MYNLPEVAVADIVDLINWYASTTRLTAEEQAIPYPDLPPFREFRASKAGMIAAADRLHPMFANPHRAPAALNALLSELAVQPRVDDAGSIAWAVPARRDRLVAACAVALVEWVDDKGLGRHGVCDRANCVDVYVDTSHPGTRRYCSETCLNRDRVASWRARQRRLATGS